ncbi:MAG: hypothetical protein ACE5GU_00115 [Candidatus Scalinduaceae bacterium]
MFVDNIGEKLKIAREIVKDPEHFLISKYYGLGVPKGFRVDLFAAKKFKLICHNLKQFDIRFGSEKMTSTTPVKKLREVISSHSLARCPKKVFCPYCEKLVIPKRLHKLDFGDFVLFLLTAGLWAIFLFAMYLFIRRCPVCNYSLRGFKPLSKEDGTIDN